MNGRKQNTAKIWTMRIEKNIKPLKRKKNEEKLINEEAVSLDVAAAGVYHLLIQDD